MHDPTDTHTRTLAGIEPATDAEWHLAHHAPGCDNAPRLPWQGSGQYCGQPGRAGMWETLALPGVAVRHCGHPTANWPYYVTGIDSLIGRTFRRLAQAQAAAEAAPDRPAPNDPPALTLELAPSPPPTTRSLF